MRSEEVDKAKSMNDLEYLVMKARDAQAGGIGVLSTGEALASALVLNRADWLAEMGYTLAQAIDRVEAEWLVLIPRAARMIAEANQALARAEALAREDAALATLVADDGEVVDLTARLISYGNGPGYRNASFIVDVQRPGSNKPVRLALHFSNPEDTESMGRHLKEVHRLAWGNYSRGPLDVKPGEKRPRWID